MSVVDQILASQCYGEISMHGFEDETDITETDQELIEKLDHPQTDSDVVHNFPIPLYEVFEIGVKFMNEKDGSEALKLSYHERLNLISLIKQVKHGKCPEQVINNIGSLDFIGSDRVRAWSALGEMSKDESMQRFVNFLCKQCPLFVPYVEAQCLAGCRNGTDSLLTDGNASPAREGASHSESIRSNESEERAQIREALNQQTYPHFKLYAQQQHPGDINAQEQLIQQLQEEHFNQYMNHVYKQQRLHQMQQTEQLKALKAAGKATKLPETEQDPMDENDNKPFDSDKESSHSSNNDEEYPPLIAASMWTRKEINEFKDMLRNEKESILHVSSGETLTVRVPTHDEGRFIYWEFATDYYDIGFGVYFEWTICPNNLVTIHVSDSSDDEEEGETSQSADFDAKMKEDIELGKPNKPPCDEIIPIYRRESHLEVFAGSHRYPGKGVYLLKFDNSYSLWRSKTIYYRIRYGQ